MNSLITLAILAVIGWFLQSLNPSRTPRRMDPVEQDGNSIETSNRSTPDWLSEWTKEEQQRAGGKLPAKKPRPRQPKPQVQAEVFPQEQRLMTPNNILGESLSPKAAVVATATSQPDVDTPSVATPEQIMQGVIWAEILQKPKALRYKN